MMSTGAGMTGAGLATAASGGGVVIAAEGAAISVAGGAVVAASAQVAATAAGNLGDDTQKKEYYDKAECDEASSRQVEKKEDINKYKHYDAKTIEKMNGLKKNEYHRDVKPEILKAAKKEYKSKMNKVGTNPDIFLSPEGEIMIAPAKGGTGFTTGWNIDDFLLID